MTYSNQRLAAARRSIRKDQERNALFPELVRFKSPEERIAAMDEMMSHTVARWKAYELDRRNAVAQQLMAMPKQKRWAVLTHARIYPKEASYLLEYLREVNRGRSPFRDLRMTRLLRLISAKRINLSFPSWRLIAEAFNDHRRARDPITVKVRREAFSKPQQQSLIVRSA